MFSIETISQNKLVTHLSAEHIERISINGNQIFSISVSSSNSNQIKIISVLDGEYQNEFQVDIKEENTTLNLSLERFSFDVIPDDKRNAHKVIAATLQLEIPQHLDVFITSDIGSVNLEGDFSSLYVELLQGHCRVDGETKSALINTIDGDIKVETNSGVIDALSNNGNVVVDYFPKSASTWTLTSINGDITVEKRY
ncbi:hypothetical protein DFQ11_101516 [Winogradskyella epiphytica]|uniref:Adhesin n=1 Tax=Winogradskyella epiphytica TaxID=262005 RepID=A0A2V4XAK0_9FLAO|nr:hypothetical protein [Winogradskyella epiphytica]PYE83085.1 hypothetical protein DFQ11_101516 [Winogradskyella epiphytica]GGW55689.1 hypothetical protein GCM10008085_03850 [Winogradskyella epiphytica]